MHGIVEGGGDHFGVDRPIHIRDLFRSLADQGDHEMHFRIVVADRVGDVLEHGGLAGFWRRHDQAALTETNWRNQIQHARGQNARQGLQIEAHFGKDRRQSLEDRPLLHFMRIQAIDGIHAQ